MTDPIEVNGVGKGNLRTTDKGSIPVLIEGDEGEYRSPALSGDGAGVPSLWGLLSQRKLKALIVTVGKSAILPGPGGLEIKLCSGSRAIRCEHAISGHMMIHTSDFDQAACQYLGCRVNPVRIEG